MWCAVFRKRLTMSVSTGDSADPLGASDSIQSKDQSDCSVSTSTIFLVRFLVGCP